MLKMTRRMCACSTWTCIRWRANARRSVESGMHAECTRPAPMKRRSSTTHHQVHASALLRWSMPYPRSFDEHGAYLGARVGDLFRTRLRAQAGSKTRCQVHQESITNATSFRITVCCARATRLERATHNVEILEKCSQAYLLHLCTERR